MHRRPTLRSPRRQEARRALAKTSNTIALAATAHLDAVPPSADDYWHDLRRGRRWVWGGALRFLDRAHSIGSPLWVVLAALDALRWYALDLYGQHDGPPALRLAA